MPKLIWIFAGHTDHCVGFVMRWLKCCQMLSFNKNTVNLFNFTSDLFLRYLRGWNFYKNKLPRKFSMFIICNERWNAIRKNISTQNNRPTAKSEKINSHENKWVYSMSTQDHCRHSPSSYSIKEYLQMLPLGLRQVPQLLERISTHLPPWFHHQGLCLVFAAKV